MISVPHLPYGIIRKERLFFCTLLFLGCVSLTGCVSPKPPVDNRQLEFKPPETAVAPIVTTAGGDKAKVVEKLAPPPAVEEETERWAGMGEQEPDIAYLEQRVSVYEKKLAKWWALEEKTQNLEPNFTKPAEWTECLSQIECILSDYGMLRTQQLQGASSLAQETPPVTILEAQRRDIVFLESDCEKILAPGAEMVGAWVDSWWKPLADQAKAVVRQYFENGEYDKAISAYERLSTISGRQIGISAKQEYGLALLYAGRLDDAARVYQELLSEFTGTAQQAMPWEFLRKAADLSFATGNLAEAKARYEQMVADYQVVTEDNSWIVDQLALINAADISPAEMAEYTSLLRAFLAFDGQGPGGGLLKQADNLAHNSPAALSAKQIREAVKNRVRAWVGSRLVLVDNLTEEKKFGQAKAILEDILSDDLAPDIRGIVQRTMDEVVMAEAQELAAQKLLIEQSLALKWEEANKLLESKRYDEAIKGFKSLLATDYDEQAGKKVTEAARLAAVEKRKEAATLFIKASKAVAPELKKEFLVSSWRLLKEIKEKYPHVDIIDKVIGNLKVLEEQINRLDPALLDALLTERDSSTPEPPPGPASEKIQ